jgi:hypothetical protein
MIEPLEQFLRLKELGHSLTRLQVGEEEFRLPLETVPHGTRHPRE